MLARGADGTSRLQTPRSRGNCGVEDAGELQIRAGVEIPQAGEAQRADLARPKLPAGLTELRGDAVDELLDLVGADRALVGGAHQRRAQLRRVEALALAVALADEKRPRVPALIGGEALATDGALAPPTQRRAAVGRARFDDVARLCADGTVHAPHSTRRRGCV